MPTLPSPSTADSDRPPCETAKSAKLKSGFDAVQDPPGGAKRAVARTVQWKVAYEAGQGTDQADVRRIDARVLRRRLETVEPFHKASEGEQPFASSFGARLVDDDRLGTPMVQIGGCILQGHSPREPQSISDGIGLGFVGLHAAAAHPRTECGVVDRDKRQQSGRRILAANDRFVTIEVGPQRESGDVESLNIVRQHAIFSEWCSGLPEHVTKWFGQNRIATDGERYEGRSATVGACGAIGCVRPKAVRHSLRERMSQLRRTRRTPAPSAPAVHDLVKRLKRDGVISATVARLAGPKIGRNLLAFVHLETSDWNTTRRVFVMADRDDIEEIHTVAGDTAMILKVRTEGPATLEALLGELHRMEGFKGVKTFIALGTYLERGPLPAAPRDASASL